MSVNVIRVTGPNLIAQLTPLSRILCVTAAAPIVASSSIPSSNTKVPSALGFAMSDPYLAHASPVTQVVAEKNNSASGDTRSQRFQLVESNDDIITDIGGIVFAGLEPLQETSGSSLPQQRRLLQQQDILKNMEATFLAMNHQTHKRRNRKLIVADINYQLSNPEIMEMIRNAPDMWEEVLDIEDTEEAIVRQLDGNDPTILACVSLNAFLWEHTGGWQNNTFG